MFFGIPYRQLYWVPWKTSSVENWMTLDYAYFVEKLLCVILCKKSLGGYCSTFICNGLHTYALSIFGNFVKMSVLFNFVCVCILCFFLTWVFLLFSEKYVDLCAKIELKILEFSYRSNLYCMGLLEKKFRSGVFHVPVCYFLIKITSLYINWEKLSLKSIYIYVHTFVIFLAFFLPPRRERLHYII